MKKVLIVITVLCGSHLLLAQDNTLPATGNVGVGTLNPDSRLQVKGNMKVDSSLIVKDSIRVDKTFRVMDKMFVEGKAVFSDNIVGKENLKVEGNVNMLGNATVEGNFKLPNSNTLSNNNLTNGNFDFLLLNANGAARKASYDTLLFNLKDGIYAPYSPSKCDINTVFQNPTWANGPNKIFSLCPQVFVGIGTDAPRSSLDVRGVTYTASLAVGVDPADLVGRFHIRTQNPNPSIRLITVENADRKLLTLDNDGLLRAREIKVDAQAWPDYVFKPDYQLMPLSEVELHIKKEGHLPAFPSAQEIEENGMNVYEMNKLLVEKIEELTLYLIEQEKQIEAQNKRIQELENPK